MNILIIEDEARAASQLLRALELCNVNYQLEGIIDTVIDAVQWFESHSHPHLVFMDVQLADGLSFEIFQSVQIQCPIIFTTAFDQYAIKAFKFNSVDYLLKPIKQEELQAALTKYNQSKAPTHMDTAVLATLLSTLQGSSRSPRTGVLVKDGGGYVQVHLSDIHYLYSSDSITFAMTADKRYIIDETLDQFMQSVDDTLYFRINRGQVVKKSSVVKLHPYLNHRLKLEVLHARDIDFVVSRQRSTEFKQWMNG